MQKIFAFELATAMNDRPKSFRFVTLLLLSFSITIVLLYSAAHLSGNEKAKQVFRQHNGTFYTSAITGSANRLLHLKK